MADERGSLSQLVLLDETVLGTADGTTGLRVPFISYGVKPSRPNVFSKVLQGNRNRTKPYAGEKSLAGPMVLQPDVRSICTILRHAIGVPVTIGSVGTPIVTGGGTGYSDSFAVSFTGGGGAGAAGTATAVAGVIQSFTITNGGTTKYLTAPTPVFTAGGGTGGTGTVALVAPFTHEFKPGALPVGFTLESYYGLTPMVVQDAGCRFGGFSFDVGASGCLEMSADIMGVWRYNNARMDSAPVLYAVEPLEHGSVVLTNAGGVMAGVTKFGVTYGNEIEQIRTVGNNGHVYSLPEGQALPDGNLTLIFNSMDEFTAAEASTEELLKVVWASPATGTGHQVEVEWPELLYSVSGPPIEGPGLIQASTDWMSYYNNNSEEASIIWRVTNDLPAASVLAIPA